MAPRNSLIDAAKSKAAANRLAKTLSTDELAKAITNLQSALTAAKRREKDKASKVRAAKKLTALMADMGLSPSDIKSPANKKSATKKAAAAQKKAPLKRRKATGKRGPKKGTKVTAKYQLKAGGKLHKWTGRGRMPLVFKTYVDKGGSLDKCLI
jgi:DNA-binding protein H-NS